MKENIKEILLQYKNRIDDMDNKDVEFQNVDEEIKKLLEEREQKNEELKQYSTDDFFYGETQETIKSIQSNIDEKNDYNKQLKADIEQEKKTIQSEILEKIQNIKTELNDQLKKDKEDKEKLIAEISEYEARQQEFEERKRMQYELHGTEIQLSQAALDRMEEQRLEIEGKIKLVQGIDNRRETSRDDIKAYNDIIKMASDKSFESIKNCIIETSIEVEKDAMEEEWKKHVADPYTYTQEEIEDQINQAYEEKRVKEQEEAAIIEEETKQEINEYMALEDEMETVDPVTVDPAKVDPVTVDPAKVDPAKVGPAKVDPAKVDPAKVDPAKVDPAKVDPVTVDPAKVNPTKVNPTKPTKLDIVISAKDDAIYINGQKAKTSIEKVINNKKDIYKVAGKVGIKELIYETLEDISPLKNALIKRKVDPVVIVAIGKSGIENPKQVMKDYIYSIENKDLFNPEKFSISYEMENSSFEKSIDRKMQKFARFANDIRGVKVSGLKERGFKALMNRLKTLALPAAKGDNQLNNDPNQLRMTQKGRESLNYIDKRVKELQAENEKELRAKQTKDNTLETQPVIEETEIELGTENIDHDQLYDNAVNIALNTEGLTPGTIQRELKIGYTRAAKLIDEMEEKGIISRKIGEFEYKANTSSKTEDAKKFAKKYEASVNHDQALKNTQEKNAQPQQTIETEIQK